jgi:hypothetical protein
MLAMGRWSLGGAVVTARWHTGASLRGGARVRAAGDGGGAGAGGR